jgi:acyl-CoA dehydrogenase
MIRDQDSLDRLLADIGAFVETVAKPSEARVIADDAIPDEIVEEMRRRGNFGWSIPAAFGGSGRTTEELALANIALSQCSVVFRARLDVNTGIGPESLVQDGSLDQKSRLLPGQASGALTGALAVTEPEAGSDVLSDVLASVALARRFEDRQNLRGDKPDPSAEHRTVAGAGMGQPSRV